ncbi:hypothetical protein Tco_0707356 [Tanacetum coccineum]|uniref:Retrovirus-related Pol polyprotein from transposon TNT 1-94-like beta-barrel domain-containing protein n=1 Tax=Tanacetum coccineum TaxID=301880 RepID=A0ABQ4YC46_9ASTR
MFMIMQNSLWNNNRYKEIREFEQIFDELEAEYEQCVLDNKNLTIEKKNLLIKNDCLIAECLEKDICSIVLTSDIVVPPSSNCLCEDLRSACDREHTKVLELEAEVLKQQKMVIESEKRNSHLQKNHIDLQLKFQNYKQCIDTSSASNVIFEINKLRKQLQGKDDTIRNLETQINITRMLNVGSTEGSCDQQALETDRIQLKDTITSLRIQLDGLKVENVSLKRRYDELSQANTHSRTANTEKLSALTAENTKLKAQVTGKTSSGPSTSETPKVLAPGMYNLGSKYIPPPKRANWVKPTPLPKKKQVTFSEPPRPSLKPTQKPVVHPKKQTNVCVPMSTGVKPTSGASKTVPKRAPRNHSSLPVKSANARRVEAHHRTLNKKNRVDSNLLVKHSVSVSKLNNVCAACNKSLVFANHNDCLVMCDDSVNVKPHQTKRLKRQPKKEWKPIKRVWKPCWSKGRTVADSFAARLTRLTAYKFKTDCSIIPVKQARNGLDTQVKSSLSQGLHSPTQIFNIRHSDKHCKGDFGILWEMLMPKVRLVKDMKITQLEMTIPIISSGLPPTQSDSCYGAMMRHIVTESTQRKAPEPKRIDRTLSTSKLKLLLMEAKEKGDVLDAEAEAFFDDVECPLPPYDQPKATNYNKHVFKPNHEEALMTQTESGDCTRKKFRLRCRGLRLMTIRIPLSTVSSLTPKAQNVQLGYLLTTSDKFVEQQLVPFYDHFKKHIQAANETFFKEIREFEQIFDELEAEYEQCVLDNKNLTIEKKNLLIINECLIAECLEKDICSIVLTSDIVVPPSSNCLCDDLRSACDREHTKVLELEAEVFKQQKMVIESEKRNSHLQKNHIDLQLKFQNYKQCIDTSSASNAIFEINKLRQQLQGKDDTIRNLDAQINIMKVLNVGSTEGSCDQQALETDRIQLKDTITSLRIQLDGLKLSALTTQHTTLQAQVTGTISSGPSTSETPKVLAPGMYNLGSKYIPPPHGLTGSTNPLPMKSKIKPTSGASQRLCLRSLLGMHSSLPIRRELQRRVEAHHRTLNKKNRVDSNLLVKHSVSVSNLNNVCGACNKSLVFANHTDCLVMCDGSVNVKPHQTKRFKRQPRKEWKPVKRVWKPISKPVANSKPQWKPTGRHFSLFEKYPLTRIMESTDMPIELPPSASSSPQITMVVQIVLWYLDSGCSRHMTGDRARLINFVEKFIGTVRFGNDEYAAIIGYGDYKLGDTIISRVYYVEGLKHNLFSVGQFL